MGRPSSPTDHQYGPVSASSPKEIRATRIAEPVIHANESCVDVNYQVYIEDCVTHAVEQLHETHRMRYLFATEIEMLARASGLEVLESREWLSGKKPGFDTGACAPRRASEKCSGCFWELHLRRVACSSTPSPCWRACDLCRRWLPCACRSHWRALGRRTGEVPVRSNACPARPVRSEAGRPGDGRAIPWPPCARAGTAHLNPVARWRTLSPLIAIFGYSRRRTP